MRDTNFISALCNAVLSTGNAESELRCAVSVNWTPETLRKDNVNYLNNLYIDYVLKYFEYTG